MTDDDQLMIRLQEGDNTAFDELVDRYQSPLIGFFIRRYILTGTPAPKGLIGLFGQIFALDAGKRLGNFITHFRMRYCDKVQIGTDGVRTVCLEAVAEAAPHEVLLRLTGERHRINRIYIRIDCRRRARLDQLG